MSILAIDYGGTRVKAGVVEAGLVVRRHTESAAADGSPGSLREVCARIGHALPGQFGGVGFCVPGLVDESGVVASLPGKHAGIEGLDLPALLGESFGVETTVVVNDAVAYATGEATSGAGRGFDRVVVVTIGTGVGVTVIDGGSPVTRGIVGGGILGGFIPISERTDGPADSIGRADTIEALCAAQRIATACGTPTVEDAYAAFARGEATARAGIAAYRAHLTRALAALASAHAPDCVVLGGGPMTAGNPVVPGLEDAVNARMFGTYRVSLAIAALGDAAALVGVAHLVEMARR